MLCSCSSRCCHSLSSFAGWRARICNSISSVLGGGPVLPHHPNICFIVSDTVRKTHSFGSAAEMLTKSRCTKNDPSGSTVSNAMYHSKRLEWLDTLKNQV
jgi:hypothetical protein